MTAAPLIGALGGTFDPVHLGHLQVAEGVKAALALARVLLIPCFVPPHKRNPSMASAEDRLAMLRLAVDGRSGLEVSTIELEREGVSYTIDTLHQLRDGEHVTPLFVLGMDALAELPTWRQYERVTAEFDLVVVDRPGGSIDNAVAGLDARTAGRLVPTPRGAPAADLGRGGRIFHLPLPTPEVSSREVRRRAAEGLDVSGLVPPPVARYIQQRLLYRKEAVR